MNSIMQQPYHKLHTQTKSPIRVVTQRYPNTSPGFTIVELLIVIVIIGILAAITIIAYNGIEGRAHVAALESDLSNAVKQLEIKRVDNGDYPANQSDIGLQTTEGETLSYNVSSDGSAYCLQAAGWNQSYYVTQDNKVPSSGSCSGTAGVPGGGGSGGAVTIHYPSDTLTTIGNVFSDDYTCASLGMTFASHAAATITGLRWYAPSPGGTSSFMAALTNADDESTVLASGTKSGDSITTGWNDIPFTTPYNISTGVTYDAKVVLSGSSSVTYTAKTNAFPVVQEPFYQVDAPRGSWDYSCDPTTVPQTSTSWYGVDVVAHQ